MPIIFIIAISIFAVGAVSLCLLLRFLFKRFTRKSDRAATTWSIILTAVCTPAIILLTLVMIVVILVISSSWLWEHRWLFEADERVYVAGAVGNWALEDGKATLWENGVRKPLGLNGLPAPSSAQSVYAFGDDVYVAGEAGPYGKEIAVLWKNGVPQILSDKNSIAHSVYVFDGDVYVAGLVWDVDTIWDVSITGSDRAVLWKNGEPQTLSHENSKSYAVHVEDGNVYVVGYIGDETYSAENIGGVVYTVNRETGNGRAVLWKNGVPQTLGDGSILANSVYVSDGDVYVTGWDRGGPTLWKNGTAQTLRIDSTSNHESSWVSSVHVSGGDVYVTGGLRYWRHSEGALWKNGVLDTSVLKGEEASSVYVSGGNVYVAGEWGAGEAVLWKNGVSRKLPKPFRARRADANAVFVRRR